MTRVHTKVRLTKKNTENAKPSLQRKPAGGASTQNAPSIVSDVLDSPGTPLEASTRAFFEPRFGMDFSAVRVHTDSRAADSAHAVNAQAFTVGHDVVFGADKYAPATRAGQRLLAHELTHVVQQQNASGQVTLGSPTAPYEREADRTADAVTAGAPAVTPHAVTAAFLARQPATEEPSPAPPVQTSATAEREREIEVIPVNDIYYILYQTEVRWGGSSAWRANNPGNMDYTADTVAWGAYDGKSLPWGQHRFAIFPDEDTGLLAVQKFLRKYQGERDLTLMMNMFAPSTDAENKPTEYSKAIAKALDVPVTTLVKTLTDDQLKTFSLAIQQFEGWKPGPKPLPRDDPSLPEPVRGR